MVWELLGGGDHQSVSPQTTTCNCGCVRDVFAPLCIGNPYCSADATQQLLHYWNLLLFHMREVGGYTLKSMSSY